MEKRGVKYREMEEEGEKEGERNVRDEKKAKQNRDGKVEKKASS